MVEPDLLDDPPRELRFRLLPPLPGGPAKGLEVGNGVGAIAARGAEDAITPAFSLQHAPFDLGVDARGRGGRRPDDRPPGRISPNDLAKFRRAGDDLGAGVEVPGMLPGDREAAFSRPPDDADRSRAGRWTPACRTCFCNR